MRITGNRLIELSTASTSKAQAAVGTASAQLSSGLRVTTPSDDPSAWLDAQRTKLRQVMSQGAGAAVTSARGDLDVTDGALSAIGSVLAQVRALAVQGASAGYDAAGRAGLGTQVSGLFQSAVASANVRSTTGEYLLAGANSLTAPFDPTTGAYGGDASVRSVPSQDRATSGITIAGSSLTAASGLDVLPLLNKVATALSANDMATLQSTIPDLEAAVKQVAAARSQTGAAMNVLDATTSARATLEANMTKAISNDVEVDAVSAASDLAKASQALQISQAVSSHIIALLGQSTSA